MDLAAAVWLAVWASLGAFLVGLMLGVWLSSVSSGLPGDREDDPADWWKNGGDRG